MDIEFEYIGLTIRETWAAALDMTLEDVNTGQCGHTPNVAKEVITLFDLNVMKIVEANPCLLDEFKVRDHLHPYFTQVLADASTDEAFAERIAKALEEAIP